METIPDAHDGQRDRPVLPVLYSFRRCPFAMRARLAIARASIPVELREVVLREKPAHMIALSPKATVPVLWLPDGRVIDESLEIMQWATGWRKDSPAGPEPELELLIARIDTNFKYHLDRYKYASRFDPSAAVDHRAAAHKILRDFDARLSAGWLHGRQPGFADMAILPFVRQFRIADADWFDNCEGLTNVKAWLDRFLEWPLFLSVMKKYPQWREGTAGIAFPPDKS